MASIAPLHSPSFTSDDWYKSDSDSDSDTFEHKEEVPAVKSHEWSVPQSPASLHGVHRKIKFGHEQHARSVVLFAVVACASLLHVFVEPLTPKMLVGGIITMLSLYLVWDQVLTLLYFSSERVIKRQILQARKPRRIIIVRHGESEGNVNSKLYATVPDNKIQLTQKGEEQSVLAGRKLRDIIGMNSTVRFFLSPYDRTRQTLRHIMKGWQLPKSLYTLREEPRLREQDWGNFQDPAVIKNSIKDRQEFGSFYYRFTNGESGADVYTRVDSFWASLQREIRKPHCLENFVIVSHGITFRMFLMRYFRWTVNEYHGLWNPDNCQMAILELQPSGKYILTTKMKKNTSTLVE
jgi:broad specificity phosphatase PhoE